MGVRSWPLGRRVAALLLVLLVLLSAVGTVAALRTALRPTAAQAHRDRIWLPAEELVTQLQRERSASVGYLGGRRTRSQPLTDQRGRTDAALAALRRSTRDGRPADGAPEPVRQRFQALSAALETLGVARATIDGGELSPAGAMRLYTGMVNATYHFFVALTDAGDREPARQGRAAVTVGRARDLLAQEDALLAGVAAAGRLTEADHRMLVQTIGAQRIRYAEAAADLPGADLGGAGGRTEAVVRLRALEDRILGAVVGAAPPVQAAEWGATYDGVAVHMRNVELAAATATAEGSTAAGRWAAFGFWLALLLVLLAVGVSATRWLRSGRPLPAVLDRLRPPPSRGPVMGLLGGGRAAETPAGVPRGRPAVAEARRRRGITEVFLTIAQRDQDLLHRQLRLLDGLERRVSDPAVLEDLFRVDHLATRMRRHAEDLITLAGAVPGRGWRRPVPMVDVIRGAASEIEDFARVAVLHVADAALVGRAVGDTIHLLAELVENGASFSAPDTRVQVSGSLLPNGFVIEVEDRGQGMTAEAIAGANRRLAAAPEFDGAAGTRLGLLVVAQLAARHGIRVDLRPSPYGGVTAVVLVPPELVAVDPEDRAEVTARGRAAIVAAAPPMSVAPAGAPPLTGAPPQPPPATVPPRVTAAFARPEQSSEPPAGPTTGAPLPRRVPQASLAAELREAQPSSVDAPPRPAGQTPAELGARLSAFQAGVNRAQADGR